ncbi:hypothetical protein K3495_g8173 [Podosphaera aphanis]|nr:hypothetical protein K3495_g8173 [Podosphaera aphanis]
MRWALTTQSRDQIAPMLLQWINLQHRQYGKRIRAIFKDVGTEFLRLKPYCEQHGIQTDVFAPDTPEQNGVSEAANNVVLRMARSGKFEQRATKGWFMGFQANTNNIFIIYYLHWTATQGWKWVENITPHVKFNEDVIFGDELNPIDQQATSSYWAGTNSFFAESTTHTRNPPLTPEFKTPASFEGEQPTSTSSEILSSAQDEPQNS